MVRKPVDTRTKILAWPEAESMLREQRRNGSPLKVVTGYFDPLLAGHARRLKEVAGAGSSVVVLLATPANPLLPARARAELVAALEAVRYVVLPPDDGVEVTLRALRTHEVVREESSDARRTQELIRHVHEHHTS